jgi:two-component system LytT family sensor kinase
VLTATVGIDGITALRRIERSRYFACVSSRRIQPWMLVSIAWIGPAVLAVVNEIAQRRLSGDAPPSAAVLLFASGDWFVYAFLTPLVFATAKRWPLSRPHLAQHALVHAAISLAFCAAWAAAGALLRAALMPDALWGGGLGGHFVSWLFITLPFGVAVYLAVVGIEHAIRYFVEARDREIQVARLSEQLSSARFSALQAQLNPHFLFNTLNTIAVLVRDNDAKAATRIVEHLSNVLRRTLSRHRSNEVTLDEEMELVDQYLAIERARFSDRLTTAIDIDPLVRSAAVPSFALQHLVENAIRHGIARHPDAGALTIVARRDRDLLEIVVTDDGPGIDTEAAIPPGHGIANTRERLQALYGERASLALERLDERGTIATLRVPYRELARESTNGES